MRTEVPEFKRACFCFPLRYSLLLWGYFRLICIIITLYTKIGLLTDIISWKGDTTLGNICWQVFVSTMTLLDFILVVIFIIGAHKKSFKLIKTFYFYDLGLLIVEIMVSTALVMWLYAIQIQYGVNLVSRFSWRILVIASYPTIYLIVKGYVLLLVRSEIIKLSNTCQFRFVNNAAQSECTMKYMITGDRELGLENSNEGIFESKENSSQNMVKLTNESEGNMKYKKFGDEKSETENINNKETSKCNDTCLEEGVVAKKSKCNMKYEATS